MVLLLLKLLFTARRTPQPPGCVVVPLLCAFAAAATWRGVPLGAGLALEVGTPGPGRPGVHARVQGAIERHSETSSEDLEEYWWIGWSVGWGVFGLVLLRHGGFCQLSPGCAAKFILACFVVGLASALELMALRRQ